MKQKLKTTLMLGPLKVSSGLRRRNEVMHYICSCAHFVTLLIGTKNGNRQVKLCGHELHEEHEVWGELLRIEVA